MATNAKTPSSLSVGQNVLQSHFHINCHFSLKLSSHQTLLVVAMLMGRCPFVFFNIPRRSDALNFSLCVSMTRGHLVLEDKNKLHLAAGVRQALPRSTFTEQLGEQSQSILTNTTIHDTENYCHRLSPSLHMYTTHTHA